MELNHLCNFGRGFYEEQICEIILNLGQWFKRKCRLKDLHIDYSLYTNYENVFIELDSKNKA